MASRSPVVLLSSSPPPPPAVVRPTTPPSFQKRSSSRSSSTSPGLPSPSAFSQSAVAKRSDFQSAKKLLERQDDAVRRLSVLNHFEPYAPDEPSSKRESPKPSQHDGPFLETVRLRAQRGSGEEGAQGVAGVCVSHVAEDTHVSPAAEVVVVERTPGRKSAASEEPGVTILPDELASAKAVANMAETASSTRSKPDIQATGHIIVKKTRKKALKKSESIIINSSDPTEPDPRPDIMTKRSTYFTPERDTADSTGANQSTVFDTHGSCDAIPAADETLAEPVSSPDVPIASLSTIVKGLGFQCSTQTQASVPRKVSGEAMSKRRRIAGEESSASAKETQSTSDLPTSAQVDATAAAAESQPKPRRRGKQGTTGGEAAKVVKRVKKPRKKTRTITDLATAAFQPPQVIGSSPLTVTALFAKQTDDAVPEPEGDAGLSAPATVAKKPRKPRAKKAAAELADAKPPKTPKVKETPKVKVKIKKEEEYAPPLYSPQHAREVERAQGFLFGTSSQLAVEDSPTFIRDMQLAIEQSEVATGSQTPLGQKLKEAQGTLWCQTARDSKGGLLRTYRSKRPVGQVSAPAGDLPTPGPTQGIAQVDRSTIKAETEADEAVNDQQAAKTNNETEGPVDSFMDVSEVIKDEEVEHEGSQHFPPNSILAAPLSLVEEAEDTLPSEVVIEKDQGLPATDDSWMLLRSDSVLDGAESPKLSPLKDPTSSHSARPSVTHPEHNLAASSQVRSPLRPLDRNVLLTKPVDAGKLLPVTAEHVVEFPNPIDTCVSQQNTPRRPRSRKASALLAPTQIPSPKKRGRPRKIAVAVDPESPRDDVVKALLPTATPTQSQYMDIDEISDSDTPVTPSPPRRQSNFPSPAIRPLFFVPPPPSPRSPERTVAYQTAAVKPGDIAWPSIAAVIFPRITKLVTGTPPSTEFNLPNWHEKILLYDPIVLEDLTAWLLAQGLSYETKKLLPKTKAKAGKKKVDDVTTAAVESQDLGYEMVKQEVKPWMVQKWCEENSVCCLWKEGLRGGVRVKY